MEAIRTTGPAATIGAAHGLRWPHLVQLLHLFACEDLLELRFHFGFQVRQFLVLFGAQVQLLHGARG
jgi:hypothetical protein